MSLTEKLLQMDAAKIKELPEKEVKIKSLSEKMGEPIFFRCRAIDGKQYAEIQKQGIDLSKNGSLRNIDMHKVSILTVLSGVIEPDLKSKDLLAHFGAVSPKELIEKMLLAGEIADLKIAIEELSGYETEEDEEEGGDSEIKNLLAPIRPPESCISSSGTKVGGHKSTTICPPESKE